MKKIISILLMILLLNSIMLPIAAVSALTDSQRSLEMKNAVKRDELRTDMPFIKGYEGFEFRPENNMTRAEACTVITRLLIDETNLKNLQLNSEFTDLEKNAWYYNYIAYLEGADYLKSYSGKFEPNKNITRAEFVELVYAMGTVKANPNNKLTFSDVPSGHPRYNVIMSAASAGLISGRPGGIFDPEGTIKRSEVVKILCTALGRKPAKQSFSTVRVLGFTDVDDSHWAYDYIIESAYEHECMIYSDGIEGWVELDDDNDYFTEVPDGLIEKLDAEFERRKNDILATESEWEVAEGGTIWYVSQTDGDNTNDGKSPETPWKNLKKVMREQNNLYIKSGDVVLLKRGDEWHEKFEVAQGVTYSAYGEGDKPRILGSVEADDPEDWEETKTAGVYKLKQKLPASRDVGNIVFNEGEGYGMRVLPKNGVTLAAGDSNLVGNGYDTWLFPPQSFDGYATLSRIGKKIPKANYMFYHDWDDQALYIYSRNGNPGEIFDSVEICTLGHAVVCTADNVTIDNLCIKFNGSHGVSGKSCKNLTVRNCEIGWIGGSLSSPNTESYSRYGNAVEIFGTADGYYVYNNYMYQCFDCGPTVQWQGTLSEGKQVVQKDIHFYDNVLREASLEVWLSTTKENTDTTYAKLINCRLTNNMVTGSGTGFKAYNHQKYEWCSFYGGIATKAPYIDCYIEGNCFWGNRRHILKATPTSTTDNKGFIWRNNTIIHAYGSGSLGLLGSDLEKATGSKQYFYNEKTIDMLLEQGVFGLNKFYYTDGPSR